MVAGFEPLGKGHFVWPDPQGAIVQVNIGQHADIFRQFREGFGGGFETVDLSLGEEGAKSADRLADIAPHIEDRCCAKFGKAFGYM